MIEKEISENASLIHIHAYWMKNHDVTMTFMAPNDMDSLQNNGKQKKPHGM